MNEQSDQNAIDSMSENLANLFISTHKHPNQPWFNNECESERNIYVDFKNLLVLHTIKNYTSTRRIRQKLQNLATNTNSSN